MPDKDTIIKKMNRLGENHVPFFFMIDFEMNHPEIYQLDEIDPKEILFDINGVKNYPKNLTTQKEIIFEKMPVDYQVYLNSYEIVQKNIQQGNTYLLNLTFPTRLKTNLTLQEIFYISHAKYKLWYKGQFVVFSPEIFIKISDGIISSNPMKGTIDADISHAEEIILQDKKEMAEHFTIIDLIRNDLNIVASEVKVTKFRYIDHIKTQSKNLLQVSSEITGILEHGYLKKLGDIIFSLLPAGSVSGAPKKKTVEIIHEAEIYKRGYYTGIFGIFDGYKLDSGVMIRFIEKENDSLLFKSGGGITFQSDPLTEYNELIDKVYVPVD